MLTPVGTFILYATCLFSSTAAATVRPVTDLVISNKFIQPDGFNRSAVLAGGTFPGPVIRGEKNDRFMINVTNRLTDNTMLRSTSIHWHGIFQDKTNWADGAAFVTQCPIAANDSFFYDFPVNSQAGTFWYHSHLSSQYCDGLRGAFIVYDPQDRYRLSYDIDDESTIITLADWYHRPAPQDTGNVPSPDPDATLINGMGRPLKGNSNAQLAVINVIKGKKYRFRVIGLSCEPAYIFQIDQHRFTIIEADGEYTEALIVDAFEIHAGQRYSAIMEANQPVGNYWIRARPDRGQSRGFDGGKNSAILRYVGAPVADPTTLFVNAIRPLKEVNLHALVDPKPPGKPVPGGTDVKINIVHAFNDKTLHYEVNGATFVSPKVPVLLQILNGTYAAQDLLPKGSVYTLPPDASIELSIPGSGIELGGPHPFHLHGHAFYVVRSGDSDTYNYINPVRRDTVNTGITGGNATIRFVTDNAGPWFLHCHIDWHLELGLAVVFAEDPKGTAAHVRPIPPAWDRLCPRYDSLGPDQL